VCVADLPIDVLDLYSPPDPLPYQVNALEEVQLLPSACATH